MRALGAGSGACEVGTVADSDKNAGTGEPGAGVVAAGLKYYRHPYQSQFYYGAYGANRLRVKRGEQWGEFDRDGTWLGGAVRYADPIFCRWVTGEYLYNARLDEADSQLFARTRLWQGRGSGGSHEQ
jgi:hypothetical protein